MAQAVDALGYMIHPSNRSGTVLCGGVMVIWHNVSCQTRDYDDDDDEYNCIIYCCITLDNYVV